MAMEFHALISTVLTIIDSLRDTERTKVLFVIWLHDQPHMIGVYEKADEFRLADITQRLTEDMDPVIPQVK